MMKLRKASFGDSKLLFDWANESGVRRNAINSNPIEWNDHQTWFHMKLQNEFSFIYIAEIEDIPRGQIRFDLENYISYIDYSIAVDERGKGYGVQILELGIFEMKKLIPNLSTFIACVKPDNIASKRVFEKLGFSIKSSLFEGEIQLTEYQYFL